MRWILNGILAVMVFCGSCSPPEMTPTAVNRTPEFTVNATVTDQPTVTMTLTSVSKEIQSPTVTVIASPTPKSLVDICSPLAEHSLTDLSSIVSDPYHPPQPGKDDRHHGVDFAYYQHNDRAAIAGEGIQAIMSGRLAAVIHDQMPYGNMVIVEVWRDQLPDDLISQLEIGSDETLYYLVAHMENPALFYLGENVSCGQNLGQVGQTGYNIPVAHLHLETRIGPTGEQFPNMVYYDTRATPDDMAAYELWRLSGTFRHFDPLILILGDWH